MNVVIGGGRYFCKRHLTNKQIAAGDSPWDSRKVELVYAALTKLHTQTPFALVIHGGASGADELAGMWAAAHNIKVRVMPAQWEKLGRSAGPVHNRQMLATHPDMVITFPGGTGTDNLIRTAERMGLRVVRVGL